MQVHKVAPFEPVQPQRIVAKFGYGEFGVTITDLLQSVSSCEPFVCDILMIICDSLHLVVTTMAESCES